MSQNNANQDKSKTEPLPKKSIEDGIGIRLKAARESKGLSHSDLHRITGVSRMVISKYESGQNKPGAREIRLLCDALEVSPNQLIYGTEEPLRKSVGLAESLLDMGQGAVLPVVLIAPMLGAMLGREDTRTLLNLIESLLRAKSPQDYAAIMEIVRVFKEMTDQSPAMRAHFVDKLMSDPKSMQEFQDTFIKRLKGAINEEIIK